MYRVMYNPNAYRFLHFIETLESDKKPEKRVLDCGAGGSRPPLALFHLLGYETHGIDIAAAQVKRAQEFSSKHGVDLNIRMGDMRALEFTDELFPCIYSQNSIFHLTKSETGKAMKEMKRVLRKGGVLYVNFLSIEDQGHGEGKEVGPSEWESIEHGEVTIHSFYEDNEPDMYFEDLEVLMKEKRIRDFRIYNYRIVTLEYIARKP
ncbi:MAG: class I SAM-dependent methyltransferase [Candidatus Thorarchaeota archaeon]|nr:class I SAM-dependent methyltransferase [Candidatus Thorarchaeota archaeon]